MESQSSDADNIVYGSRMSSVVPASITGDDKIQKLTNADLAMKLHYIRAVYLFRSEAVEGLKECELKDTMFPLLESYNPVAGRIRRSPEDGRPFIKCNDSGVRIIEAKCTKTVDEWLALSAPNDHLLLHHDQALGPDLGFSPLLFVQFTRFKCGGLSVGLSWAHILGDPFSVSEFIRNFGQGMAGRFPPKDLHIPPPEIRGEGHNSPPATSLKKVDPVGDHWRITNSCKMVTRTYRLSHDQLNQVISKSSAKTKPFDVISAVFWKSLAKVRGEPIKTVTVIKNGDFRDRENELPRNAQVVSVVKAGPGVLDVAELAKLIAENAEEESGSIDELMEEESGKSSSSDFFVYGANLTFVNLEDLKIYEFEMKGKKPVYANYSIGGVGDEGAVLVLPPENLNGSEEGGRIVNVIVPEHLVGELENELHREWGIFGN